MKSILKKGAMFGLDARIALAIFGVLSIISGVAIMSAVIESKNVASHTKIKEAIKASESFFLDIGRPVDPGSFGEEIIRNNNALENWKGPYLEGISSTYPASIRDFNLYGHDYSLRLVRFSIQDWGTWQIACNTANNCFEWLYLTPDSAEESRALERLYNYLDETVDSGDGRYTGDIRVNGASSQSIYDRFVAGGSLYIKGIPYNQN